MGAAISLTFDVGLLFDSDSSFGNPFFYMFSTFFDFFGYYLVSVETNPGFSLVF